MTRNTKYIYQEVYFSSLLSVCKIVHFFVVCCKLLKNWIKSKSHFWKQALRLSFSFHHAGKVLLKWYLVSLVKSFMCSVWSSYHRFLLTDLFTHHYLLIQHYFWRSPNTTFQRIHPLGTTNVCTKFIVNLSNTCLCISLD